MLGEILLVVLGILIALSQLGISLGPLLAGLGIAGFARGNRQVVGPQQVVRRLAGDGSEAPARQVPEYVGLVDQAQCFNGLEVAGPVAHLARLPADRIRHGRIDALQVAGQDRRWKNGSGQAARGAGKQQREKAGQRPGDEQACRRRVFGHGRSGRDRLRGRASGYPKARAEQLKRRLLLTPEKPFTGILFLQPGRRPEPKRVCSGPGMNTSLWPSLETSCFKES